MPADAIWQPNANNGKGNWLGSDQMYWPNGVPIHGTNNRATGEMWEQAGGGRPNPDAQTQETAPSGQGQPGTQGGPFQIPAGDFGGLGEGFAPGAMTLGPSVEDPSKHPGYSAWMENMVGMGENEGLAGLADAAGGSGMGGMQTTGIVRGDEGGMSAMGRLGAAAGQPQAQVFLGNAMMGLRRPDGGMNFDPNAGEFADDPIAAKQAMGLDIGRNPAAQAAGQPAGGQQLAAGPPINDQQMEGMMQVMPNVGGDGSALGLGMGGQMAIYQQQLAKQQEMIDAFNNQGGGGTQGGGDGGGGGTQDGGSGEDGSGQRPRPWSQDVVTPSYDPRDPGNQGGGRPLLPRIPGGGGGTGEPQIFTNTGGGYVNPSTRSGGIGNPNVNVGGSTAPVNNQWQGWDFVKQGNGSSFTDDGVSEFVKNTRESGVPTASHPGGQFQPSGMPAAPNPGQPLVIPEGFNDTPAPAGLSELSKQASGRFSPGGSYDQMVAQQNQRAADSYNSQVAAGGHQDYFQKFGGTSIGGRGTPEQQRAAWDAGNANRQAIANAQRKNRQSLSNQSSGGGLPQGMPWDPAQGPQPRQGTAVLPRSGLSSLATKAKPRNITLNQMYRK